MIYKKNINFWITRFKSGITFEYIAGSIKIKIINNKIFYNNKYKYYFIIGQSLDKRYEYKNEFGIYSFRNPTTTENIKIYDN